jgi:hypothetical protein
VPDSETIAHRKIVIGGKSYADDFTVNWRGLPEQPEHGPALLFWGKGAGPCRDLALRTGGHTP